MENQGMCSRLSPHAYRPITDDRNSFYKKGDDDQKLYAVIFCQKCGDTKEIAVVDRTKAQGT